MNKKICILAAILILSGMILFTCAVVASDFDLSKLSTEKYDTKTYELGEEFSDISIKTDTANIVFALSEDDTCKVVCFESKKRPHNVSSEDGKLTIHIEDNRNWYDFLNMFSFQTPNITVYLPAEKYNSLSVSSSTGSIDLPSGFEFESIRMSGSTGNIRCLSSASKSIDLRVSTGNIHVENVTTNELYLSVSTGNISVKKVDCNGKIEAYTSTGYVSLKDIVCKSMTSKGSTGDLYLKNVLAAEELRLERSTGDIDLVSCDAESIFIKASTGSINGSLLSEKIFIADTDTGSITVPHTTSGGKCEIYTDTGNIFIKIEDNHSK